MPVVCQLIEDIERGSEGHHGVGVELSGILACLSQVVAGVSARHGCGNAMDDALRNAFKKRAYCAVDTL